MITKTIYYLCEKPFKPRWLIHKREDGSYYSWPSRGGAKSWTRRELAEKALPEIESIMQATGELDGTLEVYEHVIQKGDSLDLIDLLRF